MMRTEQEVIDEIEIFEHYKRAFETVLGIEKEDSIVYNVIKANLRLCKWFLGENVEQIAYEVDGVELL